MMRSALTGFSQIKVLVLPRVFKGEYDGFDGIEISAANTSAVIYQGIFP